MTFVLAYEGNEWACKSRKWRSIEQFKAHHPGKRCRQADPAAVIALFLKPKETRFLSFNCNNLLRFPADS